MKTYTKESLIEALIEIRNQGWIPTRRKNNDGGVGNTLEDLLGIEENNLPIPNAAEWELKAQKKDTTSLITLFHIWGFDDLYHKAGTKLHNCFFVWAESKRINRTLHFHYQDIYMLKKFDLNKFIDAIESGSVYIDFDARTGHNHGTKFRLRRELFINLYTEV